MRYLTYLVQSPVYIIDQHRLEQFVDVKIVLVNKDLINKNTNSSRIDKNLYKVGLGGIIVSKTRERYKETL